MKAIAYARYSTKNQKEKSVQDQILLCEAEADRRGDDIVAVFYDMETSGLISEREGWNRMLEFLKGNRVNVLYVHHTSRIARDTAIVKVKVRELKYIYGVDVVFVSQNFSTFEDSWETFLSVFGIGDEQYIESVRKNTWRGLYGRLMQGKVVASPRYGYKLVDGRLVIDEKTASVVRRIYELYVSGFGFKKIAQMLNSEGIPSPTGMKWTQNAVREILTSELYKGLLVWNKYKFVRIAGVSDKRKKIKNPRDKWVFIPRPELAIVSEEIWEKAREIREGRKRGKQEGRQIGGKPALFTGLITCACGRKFIKQYRNTYRCSGSLVGSCNNRFKLRENALIDMVSAGIRKFLKENRQKLIDEVISAIKQRYCGRSKEDLIKEIEEKKAYLQRVISIFERTPSETLAQKIQETEQSIKLLEMELSSYVDVEGIEIDDEIIDLLIENVDTALLDAEKGRYFLSQLIEHIKISKHPNFRNGVVIEVSYKNPLVTMNQQFLSIAGGGFEPPTSGL